MPIKSITLFFVLKFYQKKLLNKRNGDRNHRNSKMISIKLFLDLWNALRLFFSRLIALITIHISTAVAAEKLFIWNNCRLITSCQQMLWETLFAIQVIHLEKIILLHFTDLYIITSSILSFDLRWARSWSFLFNKNIDKRLSCSLWQKFENMTFSKWFIPIIELFKTIQFRYLVINFEVWQSGASAEKSSQEFRVRTIIMQLTCRIIVRVVKRRCGTLTSDWVDEKANFLCICCW